MIRRILLWSLPLALAAGAAFAQTDNSKDLNQIQKQTTQLDKASSQNQETVFNSLSKQLNIPVDTLKAQQASTNFGPGQLFIGNALASASGKTFDQIAQEFQSGKGWGAIAQENNLNLGKVISGLKRVNKQVQSDQSEQARANANSHASGAGNSPGTHGDTSAKGPGNSMGHAAPQAGGRGGRH